uniref:Melanin-concentrating hormone n=1 Tax=Neogobius melanostomus TaxID=47308 RepID=A0A8C6V096_9GOBI
IMSVFYVFFTLVLFSVLNNRWVAMALPDGTNEQDGMGLMLNEKTISEPTFGFLMSRSTGLGNHISDDKGTPRINSLLDMRMKGRDTTGPSFSRAIALLTDRHSGQFPESIIKIDRRDTDLDMLRCMIGRVYRPCWEV